MSDKDKKAEAKAAADAAKVATAKAVAEAKAAEKAEAAAAAAAKKKADAPDTPDGWARRCGKLLTIKLLSGQRVKRPEPMHLAAAQLHGWDDHRHHAGGHMLMVRDAYEKALKAVERPVLCDDGKYHYVPHPEALSEHHPHEKSFEASKIGQEK